MSLVECEDKARAEGLETATFDLCGTLGRKEFRLPAAHMGIFCVEGSSGIELTNNLKHNSLWCENFNAKAQEEETKPDRRRD